jgi:pyruvate/2-oxoglutarate dehydrogenase complex dihydrolipoamide dehydrogenase (E3) component
MRYDAIVIGAGQAGPGIATTLAGKGQRVALVEGALLGGTCLNYGCRPTKALRASARIAHQVRTAEKWGIKPGNFEVDFQAVMRRKDAIISNWQDGMNENIDDTENLDLYREFAQFAGTENGVHQVRVGDAVIESERVFINVGARPRIPDIDGLDSVEYLTNKGILELDELPQHLIIIGGGYIGLEFGQMFRRFGSEVTIVELEPHVAGHESDDIIEHIETLLTNEGVKLALNLSDVSVKKDGDDIVVSITDKETGQESVVRGSHLLVAAGRIPNSDTLNLEAVGVETNDHGYIETNERLETNVEGIWAMGDVNGRGAFTHTSYQEYEIVMANLEGGDRSVEDRNMAYALFTDPPLGRVGMSERDARESGKTILKAVQPMKSHTRGVLEGETQGLMKVLVDADTEEFLGAAMLCMHGDDLVQIISNFMATGSSYKVMKKALPIHPTVAEFLPTMLGNLEPLD